MLRLQLVKLVSFVEIRPEPPECFAYVFLAIAVDVMKIFDGQKAVLDRMEGSKQVCAF